MWRQVTGPAGDQQLVTACGPLSIHASARTHPLSPDSAFPQEFGTACPRKLESATTLSLIRLARMWTDQRGERR